MSTTLATQTTDSILPSPYHSPKALDATGSRTALLMRRVMQQSDDLVLVIDYRGKDGSVTRRVVSPIRFVAEDRILALCLSREEPRQFYLDRCSNVRVDLANNYVMPVELLVCAG
jgi:predicted DNA-binding transcriptional regulator YafY